MTATGWTHARAVAAALAFVLAAKTADAEMPAVQQNALIQTYCAVCHTDAHLNGGLSLEHFDAARPDLGVAAMIVSKLTSLSPSHLSSSQESSSSQQSPDVAERIASKMKSGALGAAGIPVPDRSTQIALVNALSFEAALAHEWTLGRTTNTGRRAIITTGIVEELPSPTAAGDADLYRLTLTCDAETKEAEMQLAWSPGSVPAGQEFSVFVDENAAFTYRIESGEKQFKGAVGTMGTGAVLLHGTKAPALTLPLPLRTLTITNLFPNQTVVFPFYRLPEGLRRDFSNCFSAPKSR